MKVLHSICQQIWKTQQWPQDWKRSVFIPIPKKGNAKECSSSSSSSSNQVASVVSNSVRPRRRQPTRLPRLWDSPGKNTGVGCHFLLQCMKVKSESEVAQLCPTLRDPMDCSPPGCPSMGFCSQEYWSGVPSPSPNYCTIALISHASRRRQWHPTPVLLPGKSHGRRSLGGCSPWGR